MCIADTRIREVGADLQSCLRTEVEDEPSEIGCERPGATVGHVTPGPQPALPSAKQSTEKIKMRAQAGGGCSNRPSPASHRSASPVEAGWAQSDLDIVKIVCYIEVMKRLSSE